MPETKAKSRQPVVEQPTSIGWASAMLSGLALVTVALMPGWIRTIARFNPVDWGSRAMRNAVMVGGDWGPTLGYLGLLVAASAATAVFATWCFRAYQRSI